jgi:hypothetical protein
MGDYDPCLTTLRSVEVQGNPYGLEAALLTAKALRTMGLSEGEEYRSLLAFAVSSRCSAASLSPYEQCCLYSELAAELVHYSDPLAAAEVALRSINALAGASSSQAAYKALENSYQCLDEARFRICGKRFGDGLQLWLTKVAGRGETQQSSLASHLKEFIKSRCTL